MSEFSVSVQVPTGLDPAKARAILEAAACDEARKVERESLDRAALESDAGLRAWLKAEGYSQSTPIVRAHVYGESGICDSQIIPGTYNTWANDPRRPVLMRGSIRVCIYRYGWSQFHTSANGWCARIVNRYIRRMKWTCFDESEFIEWFHHVHRNLKEKYCLSYHFSQYFYEWHGGGSCQVYFKGRRIWVTRARRERWLAARAKREQLNRIILPSRISAAVAQQALRELGIVAPRRESALVMRSILDQPVKESLDA